MNCEQIQPDLLDYGKGLLSGPEAREVKAHLDACPECAALLQEEMAFAGKLSAFPVEEPANDVWALVRTRTKPKAFRPLAWLSGLWTAPVVVRRSAAAVAAAAVIAFTVYSVVPQTPPDKPVNPRPDTVVVKWSDDPLGNHADAMVKSIDNM